VARMYPDDIEGHEKATDGEKTVFRFLKESARPHKDYIYWYEPLTGDSGRIRGQPVDIRHSWRTYGHPQQTLLILEKLPKRVCENDEETLP